MNIQTGDPYIYAVTRAHIHEQHLLSRRDFETLQNAENLDLLTAKGWETQLDPSEMIRRESEKTWALIAEAAGDIEALNVFRLKQDFHNLKAAIKLVYANEPEENWGRCFQPTGLVDLDRIQKAAKNMDYSSLPEPLAKAGAQAWEILKSTGNGQFCEVVIDRAALEEIYQEGKRSGVPLLLAYAELTVDAANVITVIRSQKRDRSFLELAVASGGRLPKEDLIKAALSDVPKLLRTHGYEQAAAALAESLTAFERWRGEAIMELIKPQRGAISGVEPLAAFILARENEIRMVRLILSAKINHLSADTVRERLGQTYV